MKPLKALQAEKKMLAGKMPRTAEIIKGTLVEMEKICGKPNCRCTKGHKHKGLGLSQYVNGESRLQYIPKRIEKQVREGVRNYKQLKKSIHELSAINLELLKRDK